MSFLGCIGHLMEGSGLDDVLEVAYAPNAVIHMLRGKAVSRAIRGHMTVNSALNALLTADCFNLNLPLPELPIESDDLETEEVDSTEEMSQDVFDAVPVVGASRKPTGIREESRIKENEIANAAELFDSLITPGGDVGLDETGNADFSSSVERSLSWKKNELKEFPTASLWLQYMHLIDLLCHFL